MVGFFFLSQSHITDNILPNNLHHVTSPISFVIFSQLMAYAKKYQYLILTKEDTLEM